MGLLVILLLLLLVVVVTTTSDSNNNDGIFWFGVAIFVAVMVVILGVVEYLMFAKKAKNGICTLTE